MFYSNSRLDTLLKLCVAYIRPHLEYCSPAHYPDPLIMQLESHYIIRSSAPNRLIAPHSNTTYRQRSFFLQQLQLGTKYLMKLKHVPLLAHTNVCVFHSYLLFIILLLLYYSLFPWLWRMHTFSIVLLCVLATYAEPIIYKNVTWSTTVSLERQQKLNRSISLSGGAIKLCEIHLLVLSTLTKMA